MDYETVVGLEIHAELSTETKIFCSCGTGFGASPNSQVCPVCLGMPGALPALNERVLRFAVIAGLALNCEISGRVEFDRKHYFYPDLPKSYQISQRFNPLCQKGHVDFDCGGEPRRADILEIHMEEDAGKLIHDSSSGLTLVDFNRAGVPLIEIVTEPSFRSAAEASAFIEELRGILTCLGVSDCKMQEGSLRVDVNVSVRPAGSPEMGVRSELKNLGSVRAVRQAIEYESGRQRELLNSGFPIVQETRRWDEDKGRSFAMRAKTDSEGYLYMPEPELPALALTAEYISGVEADIPELPAAKRSRYVNRCALAEADARLLASNARIAELFEMTANISGNARESANIVTGEILRLISAAGITPDTMRFDEKKLADIVQMISAGRINRSSAKLLTERLFIDNIDPKEYAAAQDLFMVTDAAAIEQAVIDTLRENAGAVQDYKNGKEKAALALMGAVMRELGGRADPAVVNEILRKNLARK